jgi:hypothetical protein
MKTEFFIRVSRLDGRDPVWQYLGPFSSFGKASLVMLIVRFLVRLSYGRFSLCRIIERPSLDENPYVFVRQGALVLWRDPCIFDYVAADRVEQDSRVFRVVEGGDRDEGSSLDNDILLLSDGFSEVEAFAHEVDVVRKNQKEQKTC